MEWREKLKTFIPEEAQNYFINDNTETSIEFPVLNYPEKPKSLNCSNTILYKGVLKGLKG